MIEDLNSVSKPTIRFCQTMPSRVWCQQKVEQPEFRCILLRASRSSWAYLELTTGLLGMCATGIVDVTIPLVWSQGISYEGRSEENRPLTSKKNKKKITWQRQIHWLRANFLPTPGETVEIETQPQINVVTNIQADQPNRLLTCSCFSFAAISCPFSSTTIHEI